MHLLHRRHFSLTALSACAAALIPTAARSRPADAQAMPSFEEIERSGRGRMGIAVLDTATGSLQGHRLDERFPMCSTFKWLAAAHVLHRVDRNEERLDRRVTYGRDVLVSHSPLTEPHAGKDGMTMGELCHATITQSDNAAANLILNTLGGPQGLTAFARMAGDDVTRLDRWETELNEATPGDPRDTTSPRAMAQLLKTLVLGDLLSAASRAQLVQWMQATTTNRNRLASGLPGGWRVGSKTGTGGRGSTNDVGIYWPPGRPPVVAVAYLTASSADMPVREGAIAQVAHGVFEARR